MDPYCLHCGLLLRKVSNYEVVLNLDTWLASLTLWTIREYHLQSLDFFCWNSTENCRNTLIDNSPLMLKTIKPTVEETIYERIFLVFGGLCEKYWLYYISVQRPFISNDFLPRILGKRLINAFFYSYQKHSENKGCYLQFCHLRFPH